MIYIFFNLAACEPGSKLNTGDNKCDPCPVGFYQPEKWMETCEPCGDDKITDGTGAVNQTQCKCKLHTPNS